MSVSDSVSRVAATDPTVGVAVSNAAVKNAIVAGMQTGDAATASLLGATTAQSQEVSKLLSSLGHNVDLKA